LHLWKNPDILNQNLATPHHQLGVSFPSQWAAALAYAIMLLLRIFWWQTFSLA
jgi:hypothetical protein